VTLLGAVAQATRLRPERRDENFVHTRQELVAIRRKALGLFEITTRRLIVVGSQRQAPEANEYGEPLIFPSPLELLLQEPPGFRFLARRDVEVGEMDGARVGVWQPFVKPFASSTAAVTVPGARRQAWPRSASAWSMRILAACALAAPGRPRPSSAWR